MTEPESFTDPAVNAPPIIQPVDLKSANGSASIEVSDNVVSNEFGSDVTELEYSDSVMESDSAELESTVELTEIEEEVTVTDETGHTVKVRRKRKVRRQDAHVLKLQGRRAICRHIADIAGDMLKTVKLRILNRHVESTRGMEDEDLTVKIKKDAAKLSEKGKVLETLNEADPDVHRGHLKAIVIAILLQEESYCLDETRLDQKVVDYEKELVKRSKAIDFFDQKAQGLERWHQYDTYRVVLETAWHNDETISADESRLLKRLRDHLNISQEEHWLIGASLKRFPRGKNILHSADDINEARKELQRCGLVWSFRDENNRNLDVIPAEIAAVIRKDIRLELQLTNFRRLLNHDGIVLPELRRLLERYGYNKSGNKVELVERIVKSNIAPSTILDELDRKKLSDMCAYVALKTSGNKSELIERLIDFYDDLSFEERVTKDDREIWYANYDLLAARAYADLRAKKVISKDLDIEHQFERATEFLFQVKLNVVCDMSRKDTKADGRLPLEDRQVILWDCKSCEGHVNLQDFLDGQFDGYLRKERETGSNPLAFLVIGPAFTPQSLKLAHQYKARTNWDFALVTAEALKHLAERWSALEPGKPFPIRLFNRTELIDKERADFLLSLA